jgi:flagellar hook protein FlgE
MLDAIQIGVSGLLGYQQGLRVIANNTANMNTPGFKASTLQFSDLLHANGGSNGAAGFEPGYGLGTAGTRLDFRQGDLRQTGNDLDLAVDGDGLFTVRDAQGHIRYTRAGQFQFDAKGLLVTRTDGNQVLGLDASGRLGTVSLEGLRVAPGKATTSVRFTGNLSSTTPQQSVGAVKVFDAQGAQHTLTVNFTSTAADQPGSWKVELLEGDTSFGTAKLVFADGQPTADSRQPTFTFKPAGGSAQQVTLDFSSDVTSFAAGDLSTLAMSTQDGYAPGNLGKVAFDETGTLVATYTSGQTRKGARLALGRFTTPDAVQDIGGNLFAAAQGIAWQQGVGGVAGFGSIRGGMLESSNVDLSREFSDLVVMQRGYQAASQVISTANDMLQELFGMRNK